MMRRVLILATMAFFALVASAFAHSPSPIPGTETATAVQNFDPVTGALVSRTVTVSGQWSWQDQNGSCDNHGRSNPLQGVAVSWDDPTQPGNLVANDPNPPHEPVLVGTPSDNQIHPNPCGTFNAAAKLTTGTWGPLSHTYPASVSGALHICPVTYHIKDTNKTAGGPNHETDNSIEENNAGVDVGCFTFAFPGLATTASASSAIGVPISDTATLSGTDPAQPATGTVTWALYRFDPGTTITGSRCTAANQVATGTLSSPVANNSATSPSFQPTVAGIYQWTATYGGDAHNSPVGPVGCGVATEQTSWTPFAPAIALVKKQKIDGSNADFTHDQLTGTVGQKVDYQMTVTNTGNVTLTLSFSDPVCDAGTLTGPTGNLDANGHLPPGASTVYTCSHVLVAADRPQVVNVATVTGTPPPSEGPPVMATDHVVTLVPAAPAPGLTVIKEQRDASSASGFTTDPITAKVGDTVLYQMIVSNIGDVPLTLSFSDPHCDAETLSGPIGDLLPNGQLAAHGTAIYNCSHVIAAGDVPQFTNVVTVTGTPPSGPPVGPLSASVVANVPRAGQGPACTVGPVALRGAVGCTRRAFTAIVQGSGIRSVTFFLDGRKVRTVLAPNHNGHFGLLVVPKRLRVGGHVLTARITLTCHGQHRTVTLHFRHCRPPSPKFTG